MESLGRRTFLPAGITGMMLLLMLGCASSSTRVTFVGPPNSVMQVNAKYYHLPAQIELERPGTAGQSKRYDVSLVFTTQEPREGRAKGYIDVIGYNETEVDRLAVNTCNFDEAHLAKILEGTVVVFKGQSASRQPIYELTLGKQ